MSAAKTSVVSADKTSAVSADISQDIPQAVSRQGRPRSGFPSVDNAWGMSWETTDVLSADTTDVLSADTTDVLSADTTDVLSADTKQVPSSRLGGASGRGARLSSTAPAHQIEPKRIGSQA